MENATRNRPVSWFGLSTAGSGPPRSGTVGELPEPPAPVPIRRTRWRVVLTERNAIYSDGSTVTWDSDTCNGCTDLMATWLRLNADDDDEFIVHYEEYEL